ncbi:MAG TPA: spore germination protein GerW family protein [Methanotrichaceae archaeon]|nr:spore germination protein GerW family protein [Methanotrichaceae archaeon]
MEGLSEIIRTITGEMQKSLSARTVVGDPITIEGKTIVPLVSVGMGFGAGTGSGKEPASGGGGGGGGLGMKPIAVIIIDPQGVKVERLKSPKPSLMEQLIESMPKLAESMPKKKETQVEIETPEEVG